MLQRCFDISYLYICIVTCLISEIKEGPQNILDNLRVCCRSLNMDINVTTTLVSKKKISFNV